MGILNAMGTFVVSGLRSYRRQQPMSATMRNISVVVTNNISELTETEVAQKLEKQADGVAKINAGMSVVQGVLAAVLNPNAKLTVWDGVRAATSVFIYDVVDHSTASVTISDAAKIAKNRDFKVGDTTVDTSQVAAFAAAVIHPWLVNAVTGGRYSMDEVYCADSQAEMVDVSLSEDEDYERRLEEAYAALGVERELRELAEMERNEPQSASAHPYSIVFHIHTIEGGN